MGFAEFKPERRTFDAELSERQDNCFQKSILLKANKSQNKIDRKMANRP